MFQSRAFIVSNISFKAIHKNKIPKNIFELTVYGLLHKVWVFIAYLLICCSNKYDQLINSGTTVLDFGHLPYFVYQLSSST